MSARFIRSGKTGGFVVADGTRHLWLGNAEAVALARSICDAFPDPDAPVPFELTDTGRAETQR